MAEPVAGTLAVAGVVLVGGVICAAGLAATRAVERLVGRRRRAGAAARGRDASASGGGASPAELGHPQRTTWPRTEVQA